MPDGKGDFVTLGKSDVGRTTSTGALGAALAVQSGMVVSQPAEITGCW
jgi:septum formation inhibitor-activating ATPase MinD